MTTNEGVQMQHHEVRAAKHRRSRKRGLVVSTATLSLMTVGGLAVAALQSPVSAAGSPTGSPTQASSEAAAWHTHSHWYRHPSRSHTRTPAPTTTTTAPTAPTTAATTASSSPTTAAAAPAPTSSTTTSAASSGACVQPTAANTGATGTLKAVSGDVTLNSGDTLSNADVSGGITIAGSGITLSNVKVAGHVFTSKSSNVVINHVTASAMAVSSSQGVTIKYSNISGDDDGIHVTSDAGSMNTDITVENNYIHDPHGLAPDGHYDGTQVRGVKTMKLTCNNYNSGPWQSQFNSAIYLEDANGGDDNVTIANNWLTGWDYTLMLDASNLSVTNNRMGRGAHWGLCDNASNAGGYRAFASSGNVWDDTGAPVDLCGQG